MDQLISEKELNQFKAIPGEARGVTVKQALEFILEKKGKEGLSLIEKSLSDLGFPIAYKKILLLSYYPIFLEPLIFLLGKRVFGFSDENFREMGYRETKSSPVAIRLFLTYLISIENAAKSIDKMWKEYYTEGKLEVVDLNKRAKYAVIRLSDLCLSPLHCQNLIGYFSGLTETMVRDKVTCAETKCLCRGDDYHEFVLRW